MPILNFTRQCGYTLVEILIGMTILSFLFVAGYTAYREFVRRQILTATTEELKLNLNVVRQKAQGGERPDAGECYDNFLGYMVTFNADSYSTSPDCDAEGGDPGPLSPYFVTYELPETVTVSVSGTTSPNEILFKAVGGGTDVMIGGATITLTHTLSSNSKSLTVSTTGVIK